MRKAVVFYFSGTGNTWWAAHQLAELLSQTGVDTIAVSIERVSANEAAALLAVADGVGLGYPVYGSDLPLNVKEFIAALPKSPTPAFVFCTQWLWSGDGARVGAGFLHERGYQVRWAEHIFMPNNVCVTHLGFLPYSNDQQRLAPVFRRAKGRLRRLAGRICAGKILLRGFNWLGVLSGLVQRIPFRRTFASMRNDIGVDNGRCSRCGFCVENCPAANLSLSAGGIEARGACILCLRCYNFCPELAITHKGKLHDPKRGVPYRGPEGFDEYLQEDPPGCRRRIAAWLQS